MVYGNLNETSGTGVGFTRNPANGEKEFYGEFLMNAQGEDVVAGIRTPVPISELQKQMPHVYDAAARSDLASGKALSRHAGLRVHHSGWAALHAADPQREGTDWQRFASPSIWSSENLITIDEAVLRVEPNQISTSGSSSR